PTRFFLQRFSSKGFSSFSRLGGGGFPVFLSSFDACGLRDASLFFGIASTSCALVLAVRPGMLLVRQCFLTVARTL
ncbi:MAG: hypothetical protein RSG23_11095, partial [Gordonibacter sp.]